MIKINGLNLVEFLFTLNYRKWPILMGFLSLSTSQSFAAGIISVFEVSGSAGASVEERLGTQAGAEVEKVKYNPDVKERISEQSKLVLNLDFLNESVELDVVSINADGSSHAYSAMSPDGLDILTIAESNGVMMGSLIHNGRLYKFKPAGNGDTLLLEASENQLPEQVQDSVVFAKNNKALHKYVLFARLGGPDDGSKIDIIVTYTAEFVVEQGVDNIAAYIALLEQETNLSFLLSAVNTRVDIVHSYQTTYSDSTNARKDADYFLNGLDEGQKFRELRDQYHADIMVVLTGSPGYDACGYTPMLEANEANALSIVRGDCATGYYQFAHEIGHIFGTDHNIEEASGLGANYAHGYCGNGWRSIMSYNCSTGEGRRLVLWSNPDITLDGEPVGVAGVSNNVKVLNERALQISNFRFQVATPDQVTLTSPVGIIVTDTTPEYTWVPAERAETYRLKVIDNGGKVLLEQSYTASDANCASGTCAVNPVIELPFDLINWWITSENSTGEGEGSKKGIFSVAPVPFVPDATTLITPENVISNSTPTYRWNAVSIASAYKLEVKDGAGNSIIYKWYKPVDANCQSGDGECSVTPDVAITQNPVEWSVQTWNSAGFGGWSEPKVFQVFPLP